MGVGGGRDLAAKFSVEHGRRFAFICLPSKWYVGACHMPDARKCPVRNSTVNLTDETPTFLKATCWLTNWEARQGKQSIGKIIRGHRLQRSRNSSGCTTQKAGLWDLPLTWEDTSEPSRGAGKLAGSNASVWATAWHGICRKPVGLEPCNAAIGKCEVRWKLLFSTRFSTC